MITIKRKKEAALGGRGFQKAAIEPGHRGVDGAPGSMTPPQSTSIPAFSSINGTNVLTLRDARALVANTSPDRHSFTPAIYVLSNDHSAIAAISIVIGVVIAPTISVAGMAVPRYTPKPWALAVSLLPHTAKPNKAIAMAAGACLLDMVLCLPAPLLNLQPGFGSTE